MNGQATASAWLEAASGAQTPIHGTCSIGRAVGNTIVIQDDKASRRHAMVHAQGDGEFWLIDLGATNGTHLNGRRVTAPCRLADRDRIEIGSHKFAFRQNQTSQILKSDTGTERTIQDIKSLTCWLLVADIEQYTQILKRVPAEEVSKMTGSWLAICKQLVEENHGAINKFLGDGFFAYWSAENSANAGHVVKTFNQLKDLQTRESPRFRVVLHMAKVFLGGGTLNEETLMGPEVNFVFRIEKVASKLGVSRMLTEPAYEVLKPLLPATEIGKHPVTSFDGEFKFFTA